MSHEANQNSANGDAMLLAQIEGTGQQALAPRRLTAEEWARIDAERRQRRLERIQDRLPPDIGLLSFPAYKELREALIARDIDAAWAVYDRLCAH